MWFRYSLTTGCVDSIAGPLQSDHNKYLYKNIAQLNRVMTLLQLNIMLIYHCIIFNFNKLLTRCCLNVLVIL